MRWGWVGFVCAVYVLMQVLCYAFLFLASPLNCTHRSAIASDCEYNMDPLTTMPPYHRTTVPPYHLILSSPYHR